jgi:hypothetical protein
MAHPTGLAMEIASGLQFHPVMITMTYFYNDHGPIVTEFCLAEAFQNQSPRFWSRPKLHDREITCEFAPSPWL